jgi:hypothetical protein
MLMLLLSFGAHPEPAAAQLISPGKLSAAHGDLEGIRSCTRCHRLRQSGTDADRCLECHKLVASTITAGEGYHGRLVDRECDTCHKEHFGVEFPLVRLDSLAFEHGEQVGYPLRGEHAPVGCRSCHRAELVSDRAVIEAKGSALGRTFMGLPTTCAACHNPDSPHGDQFDGQACVDCHDEGGWSGADGFDHDETAYPLTGLHRDVTCNECHRPLPGTAMEDALQYAGVRADRCTACHEDEHSGSMPGRCESCHSTSGWQRVDRGRVESSFDHRGTGFLLEGAHAAAPCASCHRSPPADSAVRIRFKPGTAGDAYPSPVVGSCLACHQDQHDGAFLDRPEQGTCDDCHGQVAWLPADFDIARHNRETDFVIDGAHRVVPCASCHVPEQGMPRFRFEGTTCSDCHAPLDPHRGQFEGRSCDSCHSGDSFRITDFDHAATRYPLDGAHEDVSCDRCHTPESDPSGASFVRYRPLPHQCVDCHGGAA